MNRARKAGMNRRPAGAKPQAKKLLQEKIQ